MLPVVGHMTLPFGYQDLLLFGNHRELLVGRHLIDHRRTE